MKALLIAAGLISLLTASLQAELLWIEGEKPTRSTMNRHPWWYDQVKKDKLSGGDWISNFDSKKPGEADYEFNVAQAGKHEFWVRANPTLARLSYRLNSTEWKPIELEKTARDSANIAIDGKLDLRFIAWINVGSVDLKSGANTISFRMFGDNSNHGGLDCFVLSTDPFAPRGLLKPGEADSTTSTDPDWFAFDPSGDQFGANSIIDLRGLNEKQAGDSGFIAARNGQFVYGQTGKSVRFWAVNGPSARTRDELKREARQLAKYGVNLVRLHGAMFDQRGEVDPARIQRAFDVVETMKAEGIYTHFSIYFPLWFDPPADLDWMPGYDGKTHSFATLYFHPVFQEKYRSWWKALLTTPSPTTGKKLLDEPAVFGAELVNEDSLFFWTFNEKNIPDRQLRTLEHNFGKWLTTKYGTIDKAFAAWKSPKLPRDAVSEGRVAFRPLWNIAHEKLARDKDTAQFLVETQKSFYDESTRYLRDLGFKGLITASNWVTASPEVFGPLEKYSYMSGDFIDRHGYFGCQNGGDASEWSIRDGHTYADRSGLKFDSEEPGKPAAFVHPGMDPHYGDKPSMISETTWNRPNRYRGEAPLYLAVYGALQDSDCIVHFAKDAIDWSVKPGYFMQPWTLTAPTQFGQFPAAALVYRKSLVDAGDVMADVALPVESLLTLQGTPLPQDAAFDELRLKDVPRGTTLQQGQRIDPLIHYVGRTHVWFPEPDSKNSGTTKLLPLSGLIDHEARTIVCSTNQLKLNWNLGTLTINAPSAQGASGNLAASGKISLNDLELRIPRETAHTLLVALDDLPLSKSRKMLLQLMTEEKATGFRTEIQDDRRRRIVSIGENPWLVRKLEGEVWLKRPDAASLKVTPLDQFGQRTAQSLRADPLKLLPETLYYLVESNR